MPGPCSVSVVLPVKRDTDAFRQALGALRAASPAADDVIIVTDGLVPAAADAARAAGFRLVVHEPAGGPAAARNTGARASDADVLLFVDADVAVSPTLIGRVHDAFGDANLAAVVGCYDDSPPETNFFSQYKNLLQRFVHLHARRQGSTFWGACGAVRRRVFLDAGGFDERFRLPSVEDIELGYRITRAGHRIEFRPELEITHLKRWTMTSLLASDIFRRAVPWTWLLMRESAVEANLNLGWGSRLAAVLAIALAISLAAAVVEPRALLAAALAAALLVVIDRELAAFFRARRGAWFASRAIAWHWVYYIYSAAAFGAATLSYPMVGKRRMARAGERAVPLPSAGRGAL